MATLKLAVVPAKVAANGTHKIRIAISHKQKTSYIVTRFSICDLSQFKNGQVVKRPDASIVNTKLRSTLNSYQDVLDKINVESFSCVQLKDLLLRKKEDVYNSLKLFSDSYISDMLAESRKSTANLYTKTMEYFFEYANGDMLFDTISPKTIKLFDRYLFQQKKLSPATVGTHMKHIKAIINAAIREGVVKYESHPFDFYTMPEYAARDLDLTIDEIKLIRDSTFEERQLIMARDLFMLSYYLGGINLIDLMDIDFIGAKVIEYERKKTKHTKKGDKKISLTIPPEAYKIIDCHMGKDGKLDFGYKYSYLNFRNYVTKSIQQLCEKLGINKRVVYYSARKSLAQHGYEIGISLETIEYMIGQSMKKNRPIFSYVKIMRKHADIAMRKILDNLK